MRINKFLASCGVASRRNSEQYVLEGRVKVNGKVVTALATEINVDNDTVMLDGKAVRLPHKHIYLMMNKLKGVVCTVSDERERKTVMDYLPANYKGKRIFPIGRLDYDSEGLLLLTTDGDLANRLMHPSGDVGKTYICKVEGQVPEADLAKLRKGVELDGTRTKKAKITLLEFDGKLSRFEITITEGRNRQIRRMFETINKEVVFLKRVAIGNLKLGGLSRGESRDLRPEEIEYLMKL
ncbi:MAG: rRNA pseudouridine synthase [Clostridia bacterium]|nr:rRNA pseudouridine synthase [Clostridia bacterium]